MRGDESPGECNRLIKLSGPAKSIKQCFSDRHSDGRWLPQNGLLPELLLGA